MKITDILKMVPEVRDQGKGYKMFNDGSTEVEVGDFLYGLVQIMKPDRVLETGTYKGVSSSYMASALENNGYGHLDTIEYESNHVEESKELWNSLGLQKYITAYFISSMDFVPEHKYQIMFLDTEPHLRFHELVKFFPFLDEGGYVFIHDCPRSMTQGNINPDHPEIDSWPFGNLPKEIKEWEKSGELVRMHFPNPRGMVGWYKRHHDDYRI